MKKTSSVKVILFSSIVIFLLNGCYSEKRDIKTDKYYQSAENERIKAFCVDFNWGPGSPNGFAPWPDLHTTLPPENPDTKTQINIKKNIEAVREAYKNTN